MSAETRRAPPESHHSIRFSVVRDGLLRGIGDRLQGDELPLAGEDRGCHGPPQLPEKRARLVQDPDHRSIRLLVSVGAPGRQTGSAGVGVGRQCTHGCDLLQWRRHVGPAPSGGERPQRTATIAHRTGEKTAIAASV